MRNFYAFNLLIVSKYNESKKKKKKEKAINGNILLSLNVSF